jgi:hypothetical protein
MLVTVSDHNGAKMPRMDDYGTPANSVAGSQS